ATGRWRFLRRRAPPSPARPSTASPIPARHSWQAAIHVDRLGVEGGDRQPPDSSPGSVDEGDVHGHLGGDVRTAIERALVPAAHHHRSVVATRSCHRSHHGLSRAGWDAVGEHGSPGRFRRCGPHEGPRFEPRREGEDDDHRRKYEKTDAQSELDGRRSALGHGSSRHAHVSRLNERSVADEIHPGTEPRALATIAPPSSLPPNSAEPASPPTTLARASATTATHSVAPAPATLPALAPRSSAASTAPRVYWYATSWTSPTTISMARAAART